MRQSSRVSSDDGFSDVRASVRAGGHCVERHLLDRESFAHGDYHIGRIIFTQINTLDSLPLDCWGENMLVSAAEIASRMNVAGSARCCGTNSYRGTPQRNPTPLC